MAAKSAFPPPQLTIPRAQARRFLLTHQFLLPPRQLNGKTGAIEILRRLGCIQFDPVNVVGWNPDLVLQARLGDYRSNMLDELLYTDRLFWDGFDKVQSIYLAEDWPYFSYRRRHAMDNFRFNEDEPQRLMPALVEKIRELGPLSSLDLEDQTRIGSYWGFPVRVERAALENLYQMGRIGIHHRKGTRRYFDLVENLLPEDVYNTPDPHASEEAYQDWHVLRRVGSIGLAHPGAGERWLGILGMMTPERTRSLARLIERGEILHVAVEETNGQGYMVRAIDATLLESVWQASPQAAAVTFLAPLDNLLWHRDILRKLFDFDYTWEVYTPAVKRKYAHYVLPVLYGEGFIARAELLSERKSNALVLRNWWWEAGVTPDEPMAAAIADGLMHFARYLEAARFHLDPPADGDPLLQRIAKSVEF
ncbi:MAG TPA: crosslink repair DNA glycosylase YcaQ family protein [Bellilinea sp.]|nr:crosslink repair DNA glycosylase YcaQ family protein [Bellilinea sp.]